jgi:hypothetical protein
MPWTSGVELNLALDICETTPEACFERLALAVGWGSTRGGPGGPPAHTEAGGALSRFINRDLYRLAALSWMMPLPASLSMSDTVAESDAFAWSVSPSVKACRRFLMARRSLVR